MHQLVRAATLSLVLGLVGGCAQTLSDGNAVYNAGSFESAMAIYRPLAEEGNADAMYRISILYEFGPGVAANEQEARVWNQRAADHGSAWGQYFADMDYHGRGN